MLEQVDKLKVYGVQGNVYGLKSKVARHLNVMYNLGNDLMFWLIALLGTPFIYNFYDTLNPVMRYAHFINDPAWRPYGRNFLARLAGGEDYPDCNILRHNAGVCAHKVALEIIPQTLALDILSEVRTTIQS